MVKACCWEPVPRRFKHRLPAACCTGIRNNPSLSYLGRVGSLLPRPPAAARPWPEELGISSQWGPGSEQKASAWQSLLRENKTCSGKPVFCFRAEGVRQAAFSSPFLCLWSLLFLAARPREWLLGWKMFSLWAQLESRERDRERESPPGDSGADQRLAAETRTLPAAGGAACMGRALNPQP